MKAFAKLNPVTGVTAHDVWITADPIATKTILYVANSYGGVVAFDVTIPAAPSRLGAGNGESGLYMHTVRAMTSGGARTIVLSPEYFYGSAMRPGTLYALDATDFANIRLVGTWTNPGRDAAGNLVFSPHDFQFVNGTVYLAHHHGGVWTIDASDPAAMRTRGYYLPCGQRQSIE